MLKKDLILKSLANELDNLKKQKKHILYSYEQCKNISLEENLNEDKLIQMDGLAMRFARASDILARKILRGYYEIENENSGTMIDIYNFSKKQNLITENFEEIRDLRNFVSHDYGEDNIEYYFEKFILLIPDLIKNIDKSIDYIKKFK